MIEKIYKDKRMLTCDNCGDGTECENWADALEYIKDNGWQKKRVDGEWVHYCPDCKGA